MDLNKAVPPWRHKTWKKMHSNTMRMQNYAKLAVGTHQGYMAKHMSRCLHWSVTAEPAAFCAQAAIYIWGRNLKLLTKISSSPKVSPPPPFEISALANKWGNPPFQTHRFPMKMHKTHFSHFSGLFLVGILLHFNLGVFSWYGSFSKRAI